MKITLCGSIAFYEEMLQIKEKLEALGHEIKLPPIQVKDGQGNMIPVKKYYELRKAETNPTSWIWDRKTEAIKEHFGKVEWADAILVTNYAKKGTEGYVGANTLIEVGLAFHLGKRIFLLNQIPEMGCAEEIRGMKPEIINGDLSKLN
jgi:hypothetical protein